MTTHPPFSWTPHLRSVLNTTALAWGFVARGHWSPPITAAADAPLAVSY